MLRVWREILEEYIHMIVEIDWQKEVILKGSKNH